MKLFHSHGHVIGGSLLIAGTTIGVGMLALPIVTGPGGFFPSVLVYLLCWAFMLGTGLLLLEVCSWMPPDSNLISMARRFLGNPGKIICWIVYLFLFETVMIAHIAGGGEVFAEILSNIVNRHSSIFLYALLFSPIIYLGARAVDKVNIILFSGIVLSYLSFILISYKYAHLSQLTHQHWGKIWLALPILFTAFTYHVIIPTLVSYMKQNYKNVRLAIFFGTSIPLVVYLIWQVLILGIIPIEGTYGLIEAAKRGENAVTPLKYFVQNQAVVKIGHSFAFFTFTASYLALSLAFLDFLADGLHIKKEGIRKIFLCFLVFIPPLAISLINPNIFLSALGYAGGISCAILFGIYPPLMVWIGRYKKGFTTHRQLSGGKPLLVLMILLIIMELGIEIFSQFMHLNV